MIRQMKLPLDVDFPQIFLRIIDDLPIGSGFQAKTGGLKSEKVAFPVGTR